MADDDLGYSAVCELVRPAFEEGRPLIGEPKRRFRAGEEGTFCLGGNELTMIMTSARIQQTQFCSKKAELIGRGGTAEVFAWGEGRVLKLFYGFLPRERIEIEFNVSRALRSAGLKVPEAFEVVEVDERVGIVFERIDGISMLAEVERKPWTLFQAARQLAELHAHVHGHRAPPGLPAQREQIRSWLAAAADFGTEERAAAERALADLPDGDRLCHGDFHPTNILLSNRGPVIIDWIGATRGHSHADVARTSVLFKRAELPKESSVLIRLLFGFSRQLLHRTYLRRYLQVSSGTLADISKWVPAQEAAASAWRCGRSELY